MGILDYFNNSKRYTESDLQNLAKELSKKMMESNYNSELQKDLQYLKKEQIIKSIGKGKGTVYIIDEEK